jgi:hypothetical protein
MSTTNGLEGELKQQGAVEAARDPNSSVSAEDAQRKIVQESKKAGVEAFTFNPDASPEEKAAQARAVGNAPRSLSILANLGEFLACARGISP